LTGAGFQNPRRHFGRALAALTRPVIFDQFYVDFSGLPFLELLFNGSVLYQHRHHFASMRSQPQNMLCQSRRHTVDGLSLSMLSHSDSLSYDDLALCHALQVVAVWTIEVELRICMEYTKLSSLNGEGSYSRRFPRMRLRTTLGGNLQADESRRKVSALLKG
jgi:hypothetical protein